MIMTRRFASLLLASICLLTAAVFADVDYDPKPFGDFRSDDLDTLAIGEWWKLPRDSEKARFILDRPRDQTIAFALYTHDSGVLKMTAQLFPLLPEEPKSVTLEIKEGDSWRRIAEEPVVYPGWSAHFRVEDWDASRDAPYRLRLGELSEFSGLVRKDPVDKDEIVVVSMSCNSPWDATQYEREEYISNLRFHDPDLLFFAGDQSYHHEEHTYGILQWGVQFADVLRDRPSVVIPDDHDVGHANLWGEGGKIADTPAGPEGGYYYPADYVKMVERCQTWHLPDPYDRTPVKQGINVYYTRLRVGGVDFAIIEDRKFKSGPEGKIPQMGPRPDHIRDPSYDRDAVDLPGLSLLGERQLRFLREWGQDWSGASMKACLSQTAFCGAVHLHGSADNRLLADLDCNGWPQSGRDSALTELRRALATHLCGDQHLGVVVKHGIETFRDGPYAFTNPALVNTVYGRWWWPEDEQAGGGAPIPGPLPWTGDYEDGLGNKITMMAYANPQYATKAQLMEHRESRGDGYGLIRFHKPERSIAFECWPRFSDPREGDQAQFAGWPIRFMMEENDGRKPIGYLPTIRSEQDDPVIQVVHEESGEIVYTRRVLGREFKAPVYRRGNYIIKVGENRPDQWTKSGLQPVVLDADGSVAPIDIELTPD